MPPGEQPEPELTPAERARLRHRDRKRRTPMVVDNAGVKRVLPALHRRDPGPAPDPPQGSGG